MKILPAILVVLCLSGCFFNEESGEFGFGGQHYIWENWEVSTNKFDWTFDTWAEPAIP